MRQVLCIAAVCYRCLLYKGPSVLLDSFSVYVQRFVMQLNKCAVQIILKRISLCVCVCGIAGYRVQLCYITAWIVRLFCVVAISLPKLTADFRCICRRFCYLQWSQYCDLGMIYVLYQLLQSTINQYYCWQYVMHSSITSFTPRLVPAWFSCCNSNFSIEFYGKLRIQHGGLEGKYSNRQMGGILKCHCAPLFMLLQFLDIV